MPAQVQPQSDFESQLGQLVERAYHIALRATRSPEEAEALLTETICEAARRYPSELPRPTVFRAWFYRVLVERWVRARSKKPRESRPVEPDDATELFLYQETQRLGLHAQSRDPASALIGSLTPQQIASAVDALPDDYRIACAIYLYEDVRYAELAAILGLSLSAARTRLHRSRNMLQRTLWRVAIEAGVVQEPASGNLA